MTNRTIKVIGQGYSATPVTILAQVDGNVVYSGTVPTINEDISVTDNSNPGCLAIQQALQADQTSLFTFDIDVAFAGTVGLTLDVTGGPIYIGAVVYSNYTSVPVINPVFTPEDIAAIENSSDPELTKRQIQIDKANPPMSSQEQADFLAAVNLDAGPWPAFIAEHNVEYFTGNTSSGTNSVQMQSDIDTGLFINIAIDGVPQISDPNAYNPPKTGAWWWQVYPGSEFAADLEITAGTE